MNRLRTAVAAVAIGLVVVTSGCGVSVQENAQSLPSGALPTVVPSPKPSPTAKEDTIFFVSGRGLEGVAQPVEDHSALGVMAALAAGPPIDRQADLRTLLLDPLTGVAVLTVVSQTPIGPGGPGSDGRIHAPAGKRPGAPCGPGRDQLG